MEKEMELEVIDNLRDRKGRFIKGHKVIGKGIEKAIEFNKKNRVWNFNKILGPQSEDIKNKKRLTMIQKWKSPTWNNKERSNRIYLSRIGKKHSEETKNKIRKKLQGYKHSLETIHKRALKRKGIPSKNKGIKRSEEFKIKVSKGLHNAYVKGIRKGVYIKESKPEKFLEEGLIKNNIVFTKQKNIYGTPDFFIEPNICIFVDGDYWHRLPKVVERDKKVNTFLLNNGYKIIRFWECEIYLDLNTIIQRIKNG